MSMKLSLSELENIQIAVALVVPDPFNGVELRVNEERPVVIAAFP